MMKLFAGKPTCLLQLKNVLIDINTFICQWKIPNYDLGQSATVWL
jgi:hypothetical protein